MTDVATGVAVPEAGALPVATQPGGAVPAWVRRAGYVVLGAQFVVLAWWSARLAGRYALTRDFSIYHQAWWAIAHGHLDPFDTVFGYPFVQNHGEVFMWPLALLAWVWPHAATLLWVQDLGLVGAEAVAFTWLCDLAAATSPRSGRQAAWVPAVLAATGLVSLVADPWVYWTLSFDFHLEVVAVFFALAAARTLARDPSSRWVWVWVGLTLACGDVAATYLVGVGLGAAIAGRHWRRRGITVAAAGVIWTLVLTVAGWNRGSELASGYGYLAAAAPAVAPTSIGLKQLVVGVLEHPQRVLSALWSRRVDLYADVGPAGMLGLAFPWVAVTCVLVLLENGLYRSVLFVAPGFQSLPGYVLLPVGTVAVLAAVGRRWPRLALAAATAVVLNAVAWGVVWTPRTSSQWLRVSPAAASVLASVERQVPTDAEVVASQGILGRFSGHQWVYEIAGVGTVPVHAGTIWVVVAPAQGTETEPVAAADALVAELAGPLHADPVVARAGVWAFRWTPGPQVTALTVPAVPATVPGWATPGPAGRAVTVGPPSTWRAVSTGQAGYVVAGDYRREPPGRYTATVVLATAAPVDVEVWDTTGGVLLARRQLAATNGQEAVTLPVDEPRTYPHHVYTGAGPFRITPIEPPPGDQLEVRVWTPGGAPVAVYSVELQRAGAPR
ncbi:MAG: DUF2079 domain-containing protein [Acidimicrobiales bacterium]